MIIVLIAAVGIFAPGLRLAHLIDNWTGLSSYTLNFSGRVQNGFFPLFCQPISQDRQRRLA